MGFRLPPGPHLPLADLLAWAKAIEVGAIQIRVPWGMHLHQFSPPPSPPSQSPGAASSSLRLLRALGGVIVQLEESIGAPDEDERIEPVVALAELIDDAYDDDARMLGEYVRESGAIDLLVDCLCDPCPDVHQRALHVWSNLASDAFDPVRAPRTPVLTPARVQPRPRSRRRSRA